MATASTPDLSAQTSAASPILSNSPSIASDSFSISAKAANSPSYLLARNPLPEYVSQPNATRIASLVQASPEIPVPGQEENGDDSEDIERSMTVVSVSAVGLVNSFLDKILYDIFYNARSTNLPAINQAALSVLRKSLGKDAVAAAEANLEDLLAADDETDEEQDDIDDTRASVGSARRESVTKWNQESAWKRSRLRVMMRSELSDFDIDDDERYAQEMADSDHRLSQVPIKLSLSVEIFLAGILDFVGNHLITLAAVSAVARAHRRSLRTKAPPTSHTLVEEPDVEKAVLNSPLDRTWRSWRKSLRSRPYSTASQRLQHMSISSSNSPIVDGRRSSNDLNATQAESNDTHDDMALPGSMPGAFVETPGVQPVNEQMPDIPESHHPDPLGSHPNGKGHASDPTGAKWAAQPSRRQSGPVNKRISASATPTREVKRQRSTSLPVIPPFRPKPKVVEENDPPKAEQSEEQAQQSNKETDDQTNVHSETQSNASPDAQTEVQGDSTDDALQVQTAPDARKGSVVSAVSSHLSDMSSPEIVNGFETNQARAVKTYSVGAAALVRHVSPRESSTKLKEDFKKEDAARDISPDDVTIPDQPEEKTLSPKARNREATVGMDYTKVTILPQESPEQTATSSKTTSPVLGAESTTQSFGSPIPTPPPPQEPTHISKIRAQRTQSEGRQGGASPSTSASSSPKIGLRARAPSTGKSDPPRSDSLRRLAAENSNSQISLVEDDRNRVSGRSPLLGSSKSIHSVDNDFDALIAGGETLKLTLSPQSVRDGSVEPVAIKLSEPPRIQDRKASGPAPLTGSDSIIEEEGSPDANGNHKARATFPRPQHLRTKSAGRQSYQAREATVQTDSMLDFADFIRSTGPNNQPQPANITALPNPVKTGPPSRSGDRSRLGTSSSNKGLKVPGSPAVTSRTGLKMPSRFKAKDAKGSEDSGNADLIDFIRNGPNAGGRGGSKVDKSIAPFRTTMDSDELKGLTDKVNAAIANGSGTPASFASRPNRASISTTATGHTFSTFNSHAPLVGKSGMVTSSTAPSIISALGGTSPHSENSTPRLGQDSSPGMDDDGRKRYRNKDIYALPSDDDEDFTQSSKPSKGGKLSGYLIDTDGTSTKGKAVASQPTGLALDGIQFHPSSSATLDSSSLRPSRPATGITSGSGSRPGSSKPRLEMKSPGSASKAFAKQELADSSRQTRDLADLFNSAPPPGSGIKMPKGMLDDDDDGAPAPFVGQKSSDGKDKKSKFWKRKRHTDLP